MEKITISISMPFTEQEAKAVKKAFEEAALRKPPFLGGRVGMEQRKVS